MRTTVINVRGKDRAALQADPLFLYVGRRCAGWPASPFGNPFRVGMDPIQAVNLLTTDDYPKPYWIAFDGLLTAAKAVECYEKRLRFHRPDLMARLPELKGRRLGCWCCDFDGIAAPPRPCHAVVLARLADEA